MYELHQCGVWCDGEVHCELKLCGDHLPDATPPHGLSSWYMQVERFRRAPEADLLPHQSAIGWMPRYHAWLFFGRFMAPSTLHPDGYHFASAPAGLR